jgi:peptide/nickel transport system substrate-binding protein
VLYTYQTIVDQKYPLSAYLKGATFSAPDANTFVITLDKPNASFLPQLAQAANWYGKILPKHIYDGTDWKTNPANSQPIGTGPFKLESWEKDQQVTLVANDDYFLGRPKLDKLVFKVELDAQVAVEAFNAGTYPYLPSQFVTSFEDVKQRRDAGGNARVIETPSIYGRDLWFNLESKPLNDLRVRQAIAYGINREEISQQAFRGLWPPVYTAGSPYVPKYLNTNATFPRFDLARAGELLDQAGYPKGADGKRFKLRFTNPTQADTKLIAKSSPNSCRRWASTSTGRCSIRRPGRRR